nr:hypothetical protein [Tanacetum cinerariifolium]
DPKVSLIQPSSNELFQAPYNPPCLEHLINGLDHGRYSVLINFSPDCSICFPSLQIGSVRIWLSKVEPLLVAFNSQLKIFHTSLDDDASCKHPKRDIKSETFLNGQISQLSLYKKLQHIFDVLEA